MNNLINIYYLGITLNDATYNSCLEINGITTETSKGGSSYNNPVRKHPYYTSDCGKFGYFKGKVSGNNHLEEVSDIHSVVNSAISNAVPDIEAETILKFLKEDDNG